MIYNSAKDWQNDLHKKVLLFGMSGLGKTHVSNMLRATGDWFHYSIDYRIGTRYMGEFILDNIKREAMKNPFLRDLLRSDSINIGSNISFDNLAPLATYLGKPGDPAKGGIEITEYMRRQDQHHRAEAAALLDTEHFIERGQDLYGYDHFICDTGGSICEIVDPEDPNDPVLKSLSDNLLMVWIEGTEAHSDSLIKRFDADPKPMCYQRNFMTQVWDNFLYNNNVKADEVNPDEFVRQAYAQAMDHRQPIYAMMAKNWGVKVSADDIAKATTAPGFEALIAHALENKRS